MDQNFVQQQAAGSEEVSPAETPLSPDSAPPSHPPLEEISKEEESPDREIEIPTNIEELTLKNLDTGEQFIIGENDPDFDFDTFELKKGGVEAKPILEPTTEEQGNNPDGSTSTAERQSIWRKLFKLDISKPSSKCPG